MKKQILKTADGSTSIYLEEMDEHYHSKHGAIAESEHIFIENGLLAKKDCELIKIFEVGMGTGLNVLTTLAAAERNNLKVEMHTIEAFPVSAEEAKAMNFSDLLEIPEDYFFKIHNSDWEKRIMLSENLNLFKYNDRLEEIVFAKVIPSCRFDVIYFDAFAPEKQEEMWSETIFEKLYDVLSPNGILVTYCVKGEVRRRLQKVGFKVEKLKGPVGGKREMCRAWKQGNL